MTTTTPADVEERRREEEGDTLRERLEQTFDALGCDEEPAMLAIAVVAAWSEPHRRYHDRRHLTACLACFDEMRRHARHPLEIEAALAFHDIVYDTHVRDNEERSAEWAWTALLSHGAAERTAERVATLVLATRHDESQPAGRTEGSVDADTALLIDIDLSILGASDDDFDAFERDVRDEYAWVDTHVYRARRADILRGFLERRALYLTEPMRARYEARARTNLRRAIDALTPP